MDPRTSLKPSLFKKRELALWQDQIVILLMMSTSGKWVVKNRFGKIFWTEEKYLKQIPHNSSITILVEEMQEIGWLNGK